MSKLFMYDFTCGEHVFEDLQQPDNKVDVPCPTCGKPSQRMISGTRVDWKTMGVSTDFPSAAAKWERMQRQKAKSDKQDGPNLWMH
jgi:putative FmdB family regulatory protein